MKKAQLLKEYLQFSRKEQLGLLVLIMIIFVFAIYPFINFKTTDPELADATLTGAIATLEEQKARQTVPPSDNDPFNDPAQQDRNTYSSSSFKKQLFSFDPNSIDKMSWKQLGLRDRTIQTIMNYRSKGGRFRKPDDLQKIYGLHKDEFERLKPYITISSQQFSDQRPGGSFIKKPTGQHYSPRPAPEPIDINTADTAAYISLPGIGSKLALRIVNFRQKLGGFYSIDQVGETYGVPPETFETIKPFLKLKGSVIQKLNINTASYEALNAHPYISSKLAYLISKQRKGAPIANMESLKILIAQTNDSFEKVGHYISFD